MSKIEHIVLNGVTYDIGSTGSGVTESIKAALLQLAEKVAYIDENGQDYYDALQAALYPPADLVSISAEYTQVGTIYDTDTLDDLKPNLVVTAHMSDSTIRAVTNYTLSGTLTEGTSVITVNYGGKSTTFNVVVTHYEEIQVQVTWGGTGTDSDATPIIDATEREVWLEVPFDGTDPVVKSGATSDILAFAQRTELYSDAAGTQFVGYWYNDTQEIVSTSRTDANSPKIPFDEEKKWAPSGYYARIVLLKLPAATSVFSTNGDAKAYLNTHVKSVTLKMEQ